MAQEIFRAIVDGILEGGVYALMAVGLTLIFGVLDIINIAQGVLVILATPCPLGRTSTCSSGWRSPSRRCSSSAW